MKLIPRAGTWQVHFTDSSGQRQRTSTKVKVNESLPDKGKALANLAALDIMRAALMQDVPADVRTTAARSRNLAYALQKTMDEHWEKKKSNRSTRYRVQAIVRDVGYWPLPSITYARLEEYGLELERQGDSAATRNRKMSTIHTALTFAVKRGELDKVPEFPHWAENNVKERYLTREEEATLLASMAGRTAPDDPVGNYMLSLVPFLLDTGLRASEILLTREQDLGDRIWLPHGSTKSGRGRTVPLTQRARACLTTMLDSAYHWRLIAMYAADKDAPSRRIGRAFRLATKHAGIKGVTVHTLRHTCASRLVQAGVSLYVVKEWLGHSSITVTERYAHLAPKNMDAAMLALEGATVGPLPATTGTRPVQESTVH